MKTIIVLATHGMPPNDFPKQETAELFGLHARLEHASGTERASLESRYAILYAGMRNWPRTAQNDPFHTGSRELAEQLSQATGLEVVVGFNEFCGPSLADVFAQAVARRAGQVVAVTPMMTRGGEHSEVDIPRANRVACDSIPLRLAVCNEPGRGVLGRTNRTDFRKGNGAGGELKSPNRVEG